MADLKEIAIHAVQNAAKIKPKKKPSKVTPRNPQERPYDAISKQGTNGNSDFLGMLRTELRAPFLGLFEEYAKRCSPQNKKDLGKSMFIFKESYPFLFWICFILDFLLLIVFIYIVLYVGLRGLQINTFGLIS